MNYQTKEVDIFEIFNEATKTFPQPINTYPLQFELNSHKELFEFLLQFVTMLCKKFYSNEKTQVDLETMSNDDFNNINQYMQSIGFTCYFNALSVNAENINNAYNNRYDRIIITNNTKLKDLLFGIKCSNILYIISFERI